MAESTTWRSLCAIANFIWTRVSPDSTSNVARHAMLCTHAGGKKNGLERKGI